MEDERMRERARERIRRRQRQRRQQRQQPGTNQPPKLKIPKTKNGYFPHYDEA